MIPTPPFFAHQGGWDEVLLVLVPLAVLGVLLIIANQRMKTRLDEIEQSEDID